MAKRLKPYILTLDKGRQLRAAGVTRINRHLKQQEGATRIIKERTVVLSARIGEVAYKRFTDTLGYEPNIEGGTPLGPFVEEAMLLWLAYRAIGAEVLMLFASDWSLAENAKTFASLKRKYKTGSVAAGSSSYRFKVFKGMGINQVNIKLPKLRRTKFEARLKLVMDLIRTADCGIHVIDSDGAKFVHESSYGGVEKQEKDTGSI